MGRKQPVPQPALGAPLDGKRVIALGDVEQVRIQMPDESDHDFGEDLRASLITKFTESGRFIVSDGSIKPLGTESAALSGRGDSDDDFHWNGTFVPAATVRIHVDAMSFETGFRGNRMFCGFNERFRTPYNDGHGTRPNEFPLRSISFESGWFDRSFDRKGDDTFGSQAGLDLGEGLSLNVLFAWLKVKYARYQSKLHLRVEVDAPLAGRHEYRVVQVKGQGFFFDVVGSYQGYTAGIRLARTDAMNQALRKALAGSYSAIERAVADLPLTARVNGTLPDGRVLLGTGRGAKIAVGTRYVSLDGRVRISVLADQWSGAIGKLIEGSFSDLHDGLLLKQDRGETLASSSQALSRNDDAPAAFEKIELPWENLPKSDLSGLVDDLSIGQALLKSVVGTVLLPFRLWRYSQYDRGLAADPDGTTVDSDFEETRYPETGWEFAQRVREEEPWAKQMGLDRVPVMPREATGPVVAVIDSGMDYNHSILHGALAKFGTEYGYDFISGDARPYDDAYHGTEVASAVIAVAPQAKILPVKVFNPWGITTSAALYAAFKYAVDHGAQMIVCGWATRVRSQALEDGVAYARAHGVLVVAAAGDRGDDLREVAAYPAVWSRSYENVLTVTAVDGDDRLVTQRGRYANFDPSSVGIAAPGQGVLVANPRNREDRVTGTGVAAGLTAGALAQIWNEHSGQGTYQDWLHTLRERARRVPALAGKVEGGLRIDAKGH